MRDALCLRCFMVFSLDPGIFGMHADSVSDIIRQ